MRDLVVLAIHSGSRVHRALGGITPAHFSGEKPSPRATFDRYAWQYHCGGLFQIPVAA
jgi:hypothetical protein